MTAARDLQVDRGEDQALGVSRQARRKAMRDEAKAQRRTGTTRVPVPKATAQTPSPDVAPPPAAVLEAAVPLPRARSLVEAKPRGLALFVDRLRVMFGFRSRNAVSTESTIGHQLRTLRDELAAMQQSVDRMIDGIA